MSTWHRYILERNFPERLEFRNTEVAIEIVLMTDGEDRPEWHLQLRRLDSGSRLRLASEYFHRATLERTIHEKGFDLEDGSPGNRILEQLVSLGRAQRIKTNAALP